MLGDQRGHAGPFHVAGHGPRTGPSRERARQLVQKARPVQAVAAQRGLIEPSWCIGVRLADLHQGVQIGEISGV